MSMILNPKKIVKIKVTKGQNKEKTSKFTNTNKNKSFCPMKWMFWKERYQKMKKISDKSKNKDNQE